MQKTVLLSLTACAFSAQVAIAAEFVHPRLKADKTIVRSVVVLPPQVSGVRRGVKGTESVLEESEAAAAGLAAAVERALRDRGLTVDRSPLEATVEAETPEDARRAVASLQTRYDSVSALLAKHPKDVKKGRFSLGELSDLPSDLTADALVFVRAQGVTTTKGRGFLGGGLVGMLASGTDITCDVAVVDALTGDVLFFSRLNTRSHFEEAGAKLQKAMAKSFKKLPLGS